MLGKGNRGRNAVNNRLLSSTEKGRLLVYHLTAGYVCGSWRIVLRELPSPDGLTILRWIWRIVWRRGRLSRRLSRGVLRRPEHPAEKPWTFLGRGWVSRRRKTWFVERNGWAGSRRIQRVSTKGRGRMQFHIRFGPSNCLNFEIPWVLLLGGSGGVGGRCGGRVR